MRIDYIRGFGSLREVKVEREMRVAYSRKVTGIGELKCPKRQFATGLQTTILHPVQKSSVFKKD